MPSSPESDGEPLVVAPAYAVVVDHLRRAIHLGRYAPGDKLPPERTFAPQLGVSRVTLREAIRVLEGEGYLTTRRGATGGVIVLGHGVPREQLLEQVRERRDEIVALLQFRLVNERLAAERAATRIEPQQLDELERTIAELRAAEAIGAFRQADSAFHLTIAQAADCELLRKAVEDARAAMFLPLDAIEYELIRAATLRGHQRVLAALRRGDAAAAGRAMAAHVRATERELDAVLG
ncbi:FadR/GntR family transcriptional regulator [Conexibacter arvalis]|uniref:DNA-binding FadR family transcriptional regulator n=1 Tax=Conexibacter arvalis TaxID=912552 RepID=A0A840I725_9ACTN|nr:FCD domain-containing protein [Conexibacter arvalis]MBB4660657.1 DNA-binding FadR family transcriptional regulator [Conexibacter arvalis]